MIFSALIGLSSGLRTFTAPAMVALGAYFGVLPVAGTPLDFLISQWAVGVLTVLALAELVADKMPWMTSRTRPGALIARLISGALAGGAMGTAADMLIPGAIAGSAAALIAAFAGFQGRKALAGAFGRDLPAALYEDLVAVGGAAALVFLT